MVFFFPIFNVTYLLLLLIGFHLCASRHPRSVAIPDIVAPTPSVVEILPLPTSPFGVSFIPRVRHPFSKPLPNIFSRSRPSAHPTPTNSLVIPQQPVHPLTEPLGVLIWCRAAGKKHANRPLKLGIAMSYPCFQDTGVKSVWRYHASTGWVYQRGLQRSFSKARITALMRMERPSTRGVTLLKCDLSAKGGEAESRRISRTRFGRRIADQLWFVYQ